MSLLDTLFTSVDTVSSYETTVDAYGNEVTERWNDLPEVGGTLRQKGNASSSRTLLERYTGSTPRPAKGGEVAVDMPAADAPTQGTLRPLSSTRVADRIDSNRTGMQRVMGPDALEVGRDPTFYHGYNLRNRGMFRNNGREQMRGIQVTQRAGTRAVQGPMVLADGEREDPHKDGNVVISSGATRAVHGTATQAAASTMLLTDSDAHVGREGATWGRDNPLAATTDVVVGDGDSYRTSGIGRSTKAPTTLQSATGGMRVARWDSTASQRRGPHDTYAQHAALRSAHATSRWDSVSRRGSGSVGGRGGDDGAWRSYARTAAVVPSSIDFSQTDSTHNMRDETPGRPRVQAHSGRISATHRNDARRVDDELRRQAWRRGAPAARGQRGSDRRLGPSRPLSPDIGRAGRVVASVGGAAPPVRRRPAVTFAPNHPTMGGSAAPSGMYDLNDDETTRTVHASMRSAFSQVVELMRATVFGGVARETRSGTARVGNRKGVDAIAPGGVNTRKVPDDAVMRSSAPLLTGRSTRSVVGEPTGTRRDAALPNPMMRAQAMGVSSPPSSHRGSEIDPPRSSRGMSVVDQSHMQRSMRA